MNKASAFDMDALDSRIRELVAYARERDGEDRSNLFRNLVDLFLTGKAPTINPTRDQLLDVLQALIPHVESEGRRTTCELVANMSSPPMDLVMRLVQDRASLVHSLLTQVRFEEDELIELIQKTGREHHQAIAAREDLTANVWIALARAAPSAPPFDHQSTLALWSDNLGITQTQPSRSGQNMSTSDAINGQSTTAEKSPPKPNGKTGQAAQQPQQTAQQSATVTPLHPGRTNAAIRILRTDKDIIADRTAVGQKPAMQAQVRQAPAGWTNDEATSSPDYIAPDYTTPKYNTTVRPQSASAGANNDQTCKTTDSQSARDDTLPPSKRPNATKALDAVSSSNKPAQDAVAKEIPHVTRQAKDPGPGGWAWISDRDGFVTSISPQGVQLLGEAFSPVGSSMLDLLGLNSKLGHPVARAFQRRSGIHDAPIFMPDMDEKHQHWTLEATPFFSNFGGIFEGYEGTLTPVVPAGDETDALHGEDEATALFLDEITSAPTAKLTITPPSFTDKASVLAADGTEIKAHKPLEAIEQLENPQHAIVAVNPSPTRPSKDQTNTSVRGEEKTTKEPVPTAGAHAKPPTKKNDSLAEATTNAVQNVLSELLGPLTGGFETKLHTAHQNAGQNTATPTAPDNAATSLDTNTGPKAKEATKTPSLPADSAHIIATLDVLEEALARLVVAGKSAGDAQVRLQGEIASACVRSLKEQLK